MKNSSMVKELARTGTGVMKPEGGAPNPGGRVGSRHCSLEESPYSQHIITVALVPWDSGGANSVHKMVDLGCQIDWICNQRM